MERWTWAELGARPLWFPGLALALGASIGGSTGGGCTLFLGIAAGGALLAVLWPRAPGAHSLTLGALVLMGWGLARWEARTLVPLALQPGGAYHLEGVVEGIAAQPDGASLVLSVARVREVPGAPAVFRARLFLHAPQNHPVVLPTVGQQVLVLASLKPLAPALNWGESDLAAGLARQGIAFTGSADSRNVLALDAPGPLLRWLERRRSALGVAVRKVAPTPAAAAFYSTLAAGLRADLGDVWEQRFSQSGLAHVLSVSGLHVAALAVFVLTLLRWALVHLAPPGRGGDARRPAALLALPCLWGYVVFTGNQPPAVRSAVMASAAFGALALWRRADALNSLALAGIVLLVVDPSSAGDLSLQLSFLAVMTLILVSPAVRELIPVASPDPQTPSRLRRAWEAAREAALQAFCASVAVTLGGAALIAATFHRLSIAGLFSNIVCLPLCGALTALSAGGAALFILWPPLAFPALWAGTRLAQLFLALVAFFAGVPGASLGVPALGIFPSLLLAAGLGCFALARGPLRWGSLGVPVALAFFCWPSLPTPHRLTVTFLSVGQGDSTVLESEGEAALVDGGGVPGGSDPGLRVVVPYLRERGIHALKLAVLSHPHPDHALGLISALGVVPAARLWLPRANDDGPLTLALRRAAGSAVVEEVEVGRPDFRLGAAQVRVLAPPRDPLLLRGVNDRSTVLEVRHGQVSFLLTGDIEAAAEASLEAPRTTVLKAPHHGSTTSSTEGFVERTHPKFVVFCVGRQNRFHFPRPEIWARYAQHGAHCYRTDLHGAVRFTSDGTDVRLETFRRAPGPDGTDVLDGSVSHAQVTPDDP